MVLTGPRQSGEMTRLQSHFGNRFRYVSLELPDVRAVVTDDPRGFLELYPPLAIFDEVQCAPELLPYIKETIDQKRTRNGLCMLTGSQNLLLAERVTEALAGRAAMLCLLPLSKRETEGRPHTALAWERKPKPSSRSIHAFDELSNSFLREEYYPKLAKLPDRDDLPLARSHTQTCLERDVRTLRQVGDLT